MNEVQPGGAVIEQLARERLGFERLRPGQLAAVEALDGRISLHSPPGAGTAVEIVLPLGDASRPDRPAPGARA